MMKNSYTERQKFYASKEWKDLRELKVQINPLCERCKANGIIKPVNQVHHIIDIADNYDLRLVFENLESLCDRCHNIHTNKVRHTKAKEGKILNKRYDCI